MGLCCGKSASAAASASVSRDIIGGGGDNGEKIEMAILSESDTIEDQYRVLSHCDKVKRRTFNGLIRLVKLVSVYDGDTFKVVTSLSCKEECAEYTLRLSGIDTPELRPIETTPHRELHKTAGLAVRDMLKKIFPVGTVFSVVFDQEDKYGRLLGTVWTTGDNSYCVNRWMINNDYALPYDGGTKRVFSEEFLKAVCSRLDGN